MTRKGCRERKPPITRQGQVMLMRPVAHRAERVEAPALQDDKVPYTYGSIDPAAAPESYSRHRYS